MAFKDQYLRRKAQLLADAGICAANRELFRRFFEFEEHKLKRVNGLAALDEPSYSTLYFYTIMLPNTNRWFQNKAWTSLTKADIQRVYDGLEDGTITNCYGTAVKNRHAYYNKIFKSKPFRLAGKAELGREVIEFSTKSRVEPHFITEDALRTMVSVLSKPRHLLLFWLAWDLGENIGALLQLSRADFRRQDNRGTNEPEYLVRLSRRKLKRSRQERTEPTLYPETVRYADMVLRDLGPGDCVFPFGHRQALKLMHTVVAKTGVRREPDGQPPTWRDLRSGMACHLLSLGCSREEVQARLGHRPGSDALDAYINFMAIDRTKAKEKVGRLLLDGKDDELRRARLQVGLLNEQVQRHATREQEMLQAMADHARTLSEQREQIDMILRLLGASHGLTQQDASGEDIKPNRSSPHHGTRASTSRHVTIMREADRNRRGYMERDSRTTAEHAEAMS